MSPYTKRRGPVVLRRRSGWNGSAMQALGGESGPVGAQIFPRICTDCACCLCKRSAGLAEQGVLWGGQKFLSNKRGFRGGRTM